MASETTNTSSKRRKTDGTLAACLGDLPIGILEHMASFLSPPSRALFAVALNIDENNNNNQSDGNRYSSIAGSDWDTLDFGEIEKELASRLSDNDLRDVLQRIDAVNKLKRLRLTNCVNITGSCLEPLSGSEVVEQIDLSLIGDGKNPRLISDPSISCEDVLSILFSIIANDACALKHLQFPYKWCRDRSNSQFHAFIELYNQLWETRNIVRCLNCNQNLAQNDDHWISTHSGLHNYTCHQCLKYYYYCDDCEEDGNGEDFLILRYCRRCQRDYCKECVKFDLCEPCEQDVCEYCSKVECNECNKTICIDCVEENTFGCSYCDVAYCIPCSHRMKICVRYSKRCCNSCRLRLYQEGGSENCINCIKLLPHEVALMEQSRRLQEKVEQLKKNESSELRRLQGEVEQLKNDNRRLQKEVEQLKSEKSEK